MKRFLPYAILSVVVSFLSITLYHLSGIGQPDTTIMRQASLEASKAPSFQANYMPTVNGLELESFPDFSPAANKSLSAVVHIQAIKRRTQTNYDPFYDLFGMRPRQQNGRQSVSSGSGVIISEDGFVVTNNHVIADADELEVTLFDNSSYPAKVIGTDPSTDLGLIQIQTDRDFIDTKLKFADSDGVVVGQWVLAVGNPFNLASTATAGIVSAIGRNLEIIKDQMAIESFIQTDAAVNPGNSGGALVDLQGNLIGINTAIASPTGTYAGYAFAVPANIVLKVIDDLRDYGNVQRGYLGLSSYTAINPTTAAKYKLTEDHGIYINQLMPDGGASRAGLEEGDIITHIADVDIRSESKFQEIEGRSRPGDYVFVKYVRDGRERETQVQLTYRDGSTEFKAEARSEILTDLGIALGPADKKVLRYYDLDHGVKVDKLVAGRIRQSTNMREGFVILKVNEKEMHDAEELISFLESSNGKLEFEGFYPGRNRLYRYTLEK